ncbi:hypothetical protein HBN54_002635 [Hymenobacter sp. 1B]|uniref:Uncharacterized protein n=1 Tax=Hymenobacter artigasi TaxID=2719616 RepID=A0ABX1HM81_9BACT|nr:hypothetical protein [Hymenobacter artigasi]
MLRFPCLLLFLSLCVRGQAVSTPASHTSPPETSATKYTAAETVAVLHQMYRTRHYRERVERRALRRAA